MNKCVWIQDYDFGGWDTGCGQGFEIVDGTPSYNKMKFCPFCGAEIEEVPWVDDADKTT